MWHRRIQFAWPFAASLGLIAIIPVSVAQSDNHRPDDRDYVAAGTKAPRSPLADNGNVEDIDADCSCRWSRSRIVDWAQSTAYVGLTRQAVRSSPQYDRDMVLLPDDEARIYVHYGRSVGRNWARGEHV